MLEYAVLITHTHTHTHTRNNGLISEGASYSSCMYPPPHACIILLIQQANEGSVFKDGAVVGLVSERSKLRATVAALNATLQAEFSY